MRLKPIAALVALSIAAVGTASADNTAQINSLQAQVNQLQSQVNSIGNSSSQAAASTGASSIGVDSALSASMMSNQVGVGQELTLLQARQNGLNQMLTLGGYMQADAVYDHSNPAGNFVNPAINNQAGAASTKTNGSRLLVSDVSLSTFVELNSWMSGYIQVGKTNLGEATASSTLGVQQAYFVFGNLAQTPVYGFVGQKNIDFGSFETVDMYNSPLTRTLFQAYGNTAGVGYSEDGFNAVISAMNGGAESTNAVAVNSNYLYSNMSTTNNTEINNYAINLSYGMTTGDVAWTLGGGYLAGSAYTTTAGKTNGAWDVNGKVSVSDFDVMAEYATTAKDANTFGGRVKAWDVGADYNFPVMGMKSVMSVDYSGAEMGTEAGGKGSQYVVGYRIQPANNVWTGLEYAYTKGLVNLMATPGSLGAVAVNATATGSALNNVKNQTVALDITAAF